MNKIPKGLTGRRRTDDIENLNIDDTKPGSPGWHQGIRQTPSQDRDHWHWPVLTQCRNARSFGLGHYFRNSEGLLNTSK
jgi:hypothetical protein